MKNWATLLWRRVCLLPVLTQDAMLYFLAAIFAGIDAVVALHVDYREWGIMSLAPYGIAFVASLAVLLWSRRRAILPGRIRTFRISLLVVVGLGAVVVPLLFQLSWRATATQDTHAQQEVAVIERAGDRLATGHDPYPLQPSNVGIAPANDNHNVDTASFFPYFPGMAAFGLLNALDVPPELGDARVLLALVSVAVFMFALFLTRASPERWVRATQYFIVLPTGALPMVTGGDDLPVIAFVVLSLILVQRRRPFAAGLVAAVACSLKFTAWPIALLAIFATLNRRGERAYLSYLAGLCFVIPVIAFGFAGNTHAFIENVISFPLGLTKVKSPAASPLVGQFLVSLFPGHRVLITAVLGVVGVVIVGVALVRYFPRTPAEVARFTGFALCVATVLAPATRFGYLLYPVVLFAWSYVLSDERAYPDEDYLERSTAPLVEVVPIGTSAQS